MTFANFREEKLQFTAFFVAALSFVLAQGWEWCHKKESVALIFLRETMFKCPTLPCCNFGGNPPEGKGRAEVTKNFWYLQIFSRKNRICCANRNFCRVKNRICCANRNFCCWKSPYFCRIRFFSVRKVQVLLNLCEMSVTCLGQHVAHVNKNELLQYIYVFYWWLYLINIVSVIFRYLFSVQSHNSSSTNVFNIRIKVNIIIPW